MKSNKNLQLFLIPVLCGLAVLVAAIFAKNTTVQKSMSLTATTTVACSSSNYSNRTSDSVCPSGYSNTGNNCTATPTYTYTCPNGGNVNEDKCVYAATRQYTCATDAVKTTAFTGNCVCGTSGKTETYHGIVCQEVSGTPLNLCSANCKQHYKQDYISGGCSANTAYSCKVGTVNGNSCVLSNQSSCASGWTSIGSSYTCPKGGTVWGTNCIYNATKKQKGYTYSGNITCAATTSISTSTYTIKYNKNNTNATGTTANSTHVVGAAKTLTPNGYKLGGYIFNGWNTKANGTGTNYSDKQSVTNLSTTNGATVNLYAKWSACPAGKYASPGATSCSSCTGNTYTSSSGQSSCSSCPSGKAANSAHTGCADVSVSGIKLVPSTATMYIGDTLLLAETITPINATNKSVTWKSSNTSIATVDSNGTIKALKAGSVTITVKTKDGGKEATSKITIKSHDNPTPVNPTPITPQNIPVSNIIINFESKELSVGSVMYLVAQISPENATNKNVVWTSSNPEVATVDESGIVSGVSAGTSTITVTTVDGGKSSSIAIIVIDNKIDDIPVSDITIDTNYLEIKVNEKFTLHVTILPENATNKNVAWTSSNSNIVSVDENGNIKGINPGYATITATSEDGEKSVIADIIVKERTSMFSNIKMPLVIIGIILLVIFIFGIIYFILKRRRNNEY